MILKFIMRDAAGEVVAGTPTVTADGDALTPTDETDYWTIDAPLGSLVTATLTGAVPLDVQMPLVDGTTLAATGDAMTLTEAYDHAKDDVLTPLAEKASQASVDAIPTTPLLADDYIAPDNATVAAIAADYAKTGEAATAVAGLNDFDPVNDTVARVTLVDTVTDVTEDIAAEVDFTATNEAIAAVAAAVADVLEAIPDIPPPDVGTTITPATLDTDGHALGRVMPYGVVTAYVGTTAHYQFTADADGDFSYVLPDGSTWTLKARRAGYQTMTAEVAT